MRVKKLKRKVLNFRVFITVPTAKKDEKGHSDVDFAVTILVDTYWFFIVRFSLT